MLDYNCNGRFDDVVKYHEGPGGTKGPVFCEFGDVLLIDPEEARRPTSPVFRLDNEARQFVSTLVRIEEQLYEIKISPTGDQLTLEPSSRRIGFLTNPNAPFSGAIYGDQGFLPIAEENGKPAMVPEGRWKLLSYSIWVGDWKPPDLPVKEEQAASGDGGRQDRSPSTRSLSKPPVNNSGPVVEPGTGIVQPRLWLLSARAPGDYKEVVVPGGQTVTLPFGPPYKPVVHAESEVIHGGELPVGLWMSLVGSGGETVRGIEVDGKLPPSPVFIITGPSGEIVEQGSGEYRGLMEGFNARYSWQVPAGAAGDYRVRVRIGGGPFRIDDTAESVIHVSNNDAARLRR